MFVSLISAKQFFSIINRKLVENYKLNHFDIALDPFDMRVWFWEKSMLGVKDVETYYAYNATANLNGSFFYSPSNIATVLSMAVSWIVKPCFQKRPHVLFSSFLKTIYLLVYIFCARIRVFPSDSLEKSYNRFIVLFFSFREHSLKQDDINVSPKQRKALKHELLKYMEVFFTLFHMYRYISDMFAYKGMHDPEFYERLLYDDHKKPSYKVAVRQYIKDAESRIYTTIFDVQDDIIMKTVCPADILLTYIFEGEDIFSIVDHLSVSLFPREEVHPYMLSILKNWNECGVFLEYLCSWKIWKKNYFSSVKSLLSHKFSLGQSYATKKEIDSFIEDLEVSDGLISWVKIPEQLKEQSALIDRLVNFYITFVWGLWIARGDWFWTRIFFKNMIEDILLLELTQDIHQDTVLYYGSMLYNYAKNGLHYKFAYDNIKAGNETFSMPSQTNVKHMYSNMFLIQSFTMHFISTLLQDMYVWGIAIYLKNTKALSICTYMLAEPISTLISFDANDFVYAFYAPVTDLLSTKQALCDCIVNHIHSKHISHMKENVYTIWYWLWKDMLVYIKELSIELSEHYCDMSLLGICAHMRDTLFWFVLRYTFVEKSSHDADVALSHTMLRKIYIVDVLNIIEPLYSWLDQCLILLLQKYNDLLQIQSTLDDNPNHFALALWSWMSFVEDRSDQEIIDHLVWDDIIWWRWFLKHVTWYNKRYIMPR